MAPFLSRSPRFSPHLFASPFLSRPVSGLFLSVREPLPLLTSTSARSLSREQEEEGSRVRRAGLARGARTPPCVLSTLACPQDFVQELLAKLRGLHKQPGLRQPSPSGDGSLSPRQDRARTAPP